MSAVPHPFPELAVVPLESLRLHEQVDQARAELLLKALAAESVLKNPPAVMPVEGDDYLVLDGAHRTTVLGRLGLSTVLVQLIRPGRDQLSLTTWSQVVLGCEPDTLLQAIASSPGISLRLASGRGGNGQRAEMKPFARIHLPGGACYQLMGRSGTLSARVEALHSLISTCSRMGKVERASEPQLRLFSTLTPSMAGLVEVTPFSLDEVTRLAHNRVRLPAGITRFMLSPRALRVNYPLRLLEGSGSLVENQQEFDTWIKQCIESRRIRYYSEATCLFDE